jgi:hypothetical protein
MEAQTARDAVGNQVVDVLRFEESEDGPGADAEPYGQLFPREVVGSLLVPEGSLQRARRQAAREIDHGDLPLSVVNGVQEARRSRR